MTDYMEEQLGEFEALESIFVNELEVISTHPYIYTILIPCQIDDVDAALPPKEFNVGLKFRIPDEYPDIPPDMEFTECGELDEDLQKSILIDLHRVAEEEMGCIMVFTLVSELQERVHAYSDSIYNKKLKEKEAKDAIPVFHGTMVTAETFNEWNQKYLAEKSIGKVKILSEKLTGRAIFLAKEGNIELADNLIGDEDDEDVEVDEALFEDDLGDMDDDLEVSDSD